MGDTWYFRQARSNRALQKDFLDTKNNFDEARRTLIKGSVATVALGLASVAIGVDKARRALRSITDQSEHFGPDSPQVVSQHTSLFGLSSADFVLHPGHIHFKYFGIAHPDDAQNLRSIASDFLNSPGSTKIIDSNELLKT